MPSFGTKSLACRATCHPDLQRVLDEAIKHYDFSIIWGWRSKEDQDNAYESGHSLTQWPNSKHNYQPSKAFDVVPYPGGYDNSDEEFYRMATFIYRAANVCGVRLRWGGHFRNLKDLGHYELEP